MTGSFDYAVVWAALFLGLRHSLDVDHLAATADIAGAQSTRAKALWGCIAYCLGHAGIVLLIGGIGIMLGLSLPAGFGIFMEKIVGVTLVVLAAAIVYSAVRYGSEQKIMSRWRILHQLMHKVIDKFRKPKPGTESKAPEDLSFRSCMIIGVLHGIGVESPTQLLAVASAAMIGSKIAGLGLLSVFIVGMVISNMAVALLAIHGFQSAKRRSTVFMVLSLLSAVLSAVIGVQLLIA